MSGKDHWDAILASAPLNATAAAVVSKGYSYEPELVVTEFSWEAPPSILRPSRKHFNNPSFTDFTGAKYGRMTVLGMWADAPGSDVGALWVCRCACGRYVGRRAKSIRKASPEDRCQICRHTASLARSASGDHARRRAESSKARKW